MARPADTWLKRQYASYNSLAGRTVMGWRGVEMALGGDDEDGPFVWRHDSVPFFQFDRLTILLDTHEVDLSTTQSDDGFGLWNLFEQPPLPAPDSWTGIFRARLIDELPVGTVEAVEIETEEDMVARVTLWIGDKQVALLAGEVQEEMDGSFRIIDLNGSILVQVDGRRP